MADQITSNGGSTNFNEQTVESTTAEMDLQDGTGNTFWETSTRKKCTYFTFAFVAFCVGMFYSLMAPFFPNEAQNRGLSNTVIGLTFSVYSTVAFFLSVFLGHYISIIGAKFMYVSGIFFCGSCSILFGCLEYVFDATAYAALSISIRVIQSVGATFINTAIFAMIGAMFPNQLATLMGLEDAVFALGIMLGPTIGGIWYEFAGFKMPFIVSGVILLISAVLCGCFLQDVQAESKSQSQPMWSILRRPLFIIVGMTTATATFSIGFIDVSLSVRLEEKFGLDPIWRGMVFLTGAATYSIPAPLWGYLADRKPKIAPVLVGTGALVTGLGFLFMGPADFLKIHDAKLWLMVVSLGFAGFGLGTSLLCVRIMADVAREDGYPSNLETMGMLAGLFFPFKYFGLFAGPTLGGYLIDQYTYPQASSIVGVLYFCMGTILLLYILTQYLIKSHTCTKPMEEEEALLSAEALLPAEGKDSLATSLQDLTKN